jgi:hypothetical protein
MPAVDEYQECARLSARLAEIVPQEQERWLGMAARWAALATRVREAGTPRYRRIGAASAAASNAITDDTALHGTALHDIAVHDTTLPDADCKTRGRTTPR